MAQLNTYVAVRDADGHDVWFGPDVDLPDWAIEKITNPAAYAIAPKRQAPAETAPVAEPEVAVEPVAPAPEEVAAPARRTTRKRAGA
ncbi:hypothetical protein OG563_26460 [Nocardia vinacea]|uniref:Uncharacterized protein n=1 Tax=Nocardia vinacea TaxID=96468 RepID=A0ABZ1YKG3_9NOCA|nr:hypothetical protein [Nocardia vinacea]